VRAGTTRNTSEAARALKSRDFFKAYTEEIKLASGGTVEVQPLAIVSETSTPRLLPVEACYFLTSGQVESARDPKASSPDIVLTSL
jgi:hypothetical protein